MRFVSIPVTTTGSDGSAEGTGYSPYPLNGRVYALHVDWNASAPAGTSDIVVTSEESTPTFTYFTLENSATDVTLYPRVQVTDNTGTGLVYIAATGETVCDMYPIHGRMKVAVAGCNALTTAVTVYAYILED
jgi:hypothetical protein